MRRLLIVALLAVAGFALLPAAAASAHPLGNFSINRYAGLTLHPDRIDAVAVVDVAELPTLQDPAPTCAEAAAGLRVTVGEAAARWAVTRETLVHPGGAGGLRTSRLECGLTAPTSITGSTRVAVDYVFRDDRIGWRELVAAGGPGVVLRGSTLPTASPTGELRRYPSDPLSSPSDVRTASFTAAPGPGTASGAAGGPGAADPPGGQRVSAPSGVLAGAERWLDSVVGGDRLTPLVGLLAVLLSLLLGAAHAALPGHGKTVMAAYLAGSRGRPRDAVLVGATVTLTHTAGVLALGLLLTLATGVAGETVLGWLGIASGVLVVAVGAGALVSALRHREHGHVHSGHDQHDHAHGGHDHEHGPGKWGIAGLGIAGGLVPSPSALIVLLGAVALGRTVFGALLVLAYGLGMAATLTAAGLLLVRLRDRLERRSRLLTRWRAVGPPVTATLIIVVGAGLAGRALSGLV